jgi:hypothetical protein
MASRRFSELARIRPAGNSHPIAAEEKRRQWTATLSYLNDHHDVEFGPEVPIEIEFGWRQLPPETEARDEFRVWTGFEIQTSDKSMRGCTLVAATYPYSTDWFDWGDFKTILRRGRNQCLQPLRASMAEVQKRLRSHSELANEVLGARPGWLTARLSWPTRTEGLSITARGGSRHSEVWRVFKTSLNRRPGAEREFWCYGVCPEFEKCRDTLKASRQAQRLLEKTDDGTLFMNRRNKGRAPTRLIGATAKALMHQVLESSIIKTLAGGSPKLDEIRKLGKPHQPALLMAQIYDDTMYSLVQRLHQEPGAGIRVSLKDFTRIAAEPVIPDEVPFDQKVVRYRNRFREGGLTAEFRHAIENTLSNGSDPDRIEACAALEGAVKAGYRLHRSFEPILKPIADDKGENHVVRQAARRVLKILRDGNPPTV